MSKSPITTHILDTATGTPATGVPVVLYKLAENDWVELTRGVTDDDGRITDWLAGKEVDFGTYKLRFDLDAYFAGQPEPVFYPFAEICFRRQDNKHHHIPLLLAPFGYSTYRGS